ncbi:MAG: DNA replication and repair protein recF, partial [uncultured bacterium]
QRLLSEEKLKNNRERDIAAGITLSGPHRDDFRFVHKKRDLEFFGSRGQQRMAVLALKLAELEYHRVKRGQRPVLALDDIFSELDWEHRETVLAVIGNQQTIITAAEKESIPKEIFKKAKIVEI